MTERQRRIAGIVDKHRGELLARAYGELFNKPVGHSASVRMFYDFRCGALAIVVTKEPHGYTWVHEDAWFYGKKGRTRPKPRPLGLARLKSRP